MELMIGCCEKLAELCFPVDRLNYGCVLSMFLQDLKVLYVINPVLYNQLSENLSVVSTNIPFSRMAYDQCHEQDNKEIKSSSDYINLINNEDTDFLRKVEICSPEFDTFLKKYESRDMTKTGKLKHKEQYGSFINKFLSDCKKLYANFGFNPFQSTSQFHKLTSSAHFFPEVIVCDSTKVFSIGAAQYSAFKESCFIKGTANVDEKITKNQLKLSKDRLTVFECSPYPQ